MDSFTETKSGGVILQGPKRKAYGISLYGLAELSEQLGPERWKAISDVAQVAANYLRCHPRVDEVRYPGLKDDHFFLAASHILVGGFGPNVDAHLDDGHWYRVICAPCDPQEFVLELEEWLQQQ